MHSSSKLLASSRTNMMQQVEQKEDVGMAVCSAML